MVGALCLAAAHVAEKALLMARTPIRLIWLVALALTSLLAIRAFTVNEQYVSNSFAAMQQQIDFKGQSSLTAGDAEALAARASWRDRIPSAIALPNGLQSERLDVASTVLWVSLTVLWLGALTLSAVRLVRERQAWQRAHIDGAPVWLSHDVGPAVFGLLHYQIVLPTWVEQCSEAERRLIVAHEREHALAHDPLVILGASVLVALMPWNPAAWYLLRRLRHAIELDCDARVTGRHPDPVAYGRLLVSVGERTTVNVMPTAALAERSTLIERRVRQMIRNRPRWMNARRAGLLTLSACCVLAACRAPRLVRAAVGMPEQGIADVTRADARRLALKGLVRPARDLPPQGFEIVETTTGVSSPCVQRLRDPRDGTMLIARASTTFHDESQLKDGSLVTVKTGFVNYLVLPVGRYGVGEKEVLRMRCGTQYVLGVAPDSVGLNTN